MTERDGDGDRERGRLRERFREKQRQRENEIDRFEQTLYTKKRHILRIKYVS